MMDGFSVFKPLSYLFMHLAVPLQNVGTAIFGWPVNP